MAFTFYLTDREAAFIAGLYGLVLLYLIHCDLSGIKWRLDGIELQLRGVNSALRDPVGEQDDAGAAEDIDQTTNHATDP